MYFFCFLLKEHPELKSKFKERVQEAVKYASSSLFEAKSLHITFFVQLNGKRRNMSCYGILDRLSLFLPDLNPLFFFLVQR